MLGAIRWHGWSLARGLRLDLRLTVGLGSRVILPLGLLPCLEQLGVHPPRTHRGEARPAAGDGGLL